MALSSFLDSLRLPRIDTDHAVLDNESYVGSSLLDPPYMFLRWNYDRSTT